MKKLILAMILSASFNAVALPNTYSAQWVGDAVEFKDTVRNREVSLFINSSNKPFTHVSINMKSLTKNGKICTDYERQKRSSQVWRFDGQAIRMDVLCIHNSDNSFQEVLVIAPETKRGSDYIVSLLKKKDYVGVETLTQGGLVIPATGFTRAWGYYGSEVL